MKFSNKSLRKKNIIYILCGILTIYLCLTWIVTDQIKASSLGRLFFYNIDEIFRYYVVKNSLTTPSVFLSTFIRPIYTLIATIFSHLLPIGMLSLRIMNTLFSCASLYIMAILLKKLKFSDIVILFIVTITALCPKYMFPSVSIRPEIIFCFLLLLSLNLLYDKNYLFSAIIVSLLCLVRFEGYLMIGVWCIVYLNKKQLKYIPVLFTPLLIFISLNYLILGGDGFVSRFIYQLGMKKHGLIGEQGLLDIPKFIPFFKLPPMEYLLSLGWPIMTLFAIGSLMIFSNKKQNIALLCFLVSFFLSSIVLTSSEYYSKKHYYIPGYMDTHLFPYFPLIMIIAANPIEALLRHAQKKLKVITIIIFALVMLIFQARSQLAIQKLSHPYIFAPSPKELHDVKDAAKWLNQYCQDHHLTKIYIGSNTATYGIGNRLIMFLDPALKFYILIQNNAETTEMDMRNFSYKKIDQIKKPIIYFTATDKKDRQVVNTFDYHLLKEYPEAHLYFYALQSKRNPMTS